jgi:hypothetical protein
MTMDVFSPRVSINTMPKNGVIDMKYKHGASGGEMLDETKRMKNK